MIASHGLAGSAAAPPRAGAGDIGEPRRQRVRHGDGVVFLLEPDTGAVADLDRVDAVGAGREVADVGLGDAEIDARLARHADDLSREQDQVAARRKHGRGRRLPGRDVRIDREGIDVDAVACGDAERIDRAVEGLNDRIAAGHVDAVVKRVAVEPQRFAETVERGRILRVAFPRNDRHASIDRRCRHAKTVGRERDRAAAEILQSVEDVDGAQRLGGALIDHDDPPARNHRLAAAVRCARVDRETAEGVVAVARHARSHIGEAAKVGKQRAAIVERGGERAARVDGRASESHAGIDGAAGTAPVQVGREDRGTRRYAGDGSRTRGADRTGINGVRLRAE